MSDWQRIHVEQNNQTPYNTFVNLFVCPHCAAVVINQGHHQAHHDEIERIRGLGYLR